MLTRVLIIKCNIKTLGLSTVKQILRIFLWFVVWQHCNGLDLGKLIKAALTFAYYKGEEA
jgi:hypothetical protein